MTQAPTQVMTPAPGPSPHRLSKAALSIPVRVATGRGGPRAPVDKTLSLPPALPAERHAFASVAGRLSYYMAGPTSPEGPPLLLIHSINAAASAFEVGPIFEAWRGQRTVYALDLPGYGFSERGPRAYSPRLMTDAVLAMVEKIQRRHGDVAVDALGISLSAEFLARAATEHPGRFRSVALVSPTGFDSRGPRNGPPGSTRAKPALHRAFTLGLWRKAFFRLLTSRVSIRYFLEKTWGSKAVDAALLDYDYLTAHQPGAEHAPFFFITGFLFSNDITRIYEQLSIPVWLLHGTRGDFTDYTSSETFEARPNWTIDRMETGALPQFEQPAVFKARHEAFLARLAECGPDLTGRIDRS